MRAPLSWLRDYAPLDAGVDDLASALSELGLVVEGIERVGAGLGDVVVARILEIRPHPDADRIRLVDVDAGDGTPLQIACGAWNFSVGDLVPLAPVGAVLPGGFEISRRKMRGEWSNGMLCSASELELPEPPDAGDGLMILPAGLAEPGTPLVDALGIENDVVFDLDVSPNRPDALCMAGIARDLAARLGETWALPSTPPAPPVDESVGTAPISVDAGDLCPRFTGTVLEGVPSGPSPDWIARRLTLAGMRPINAAVDISNYVMLDLGQPNHAYDLERLGGGGILVRRAEPGETIRTLDGAERKADADDCLICDADGVPVGIGGVMGGADSEISESTRRVLLEAAWFAPMAIARTGKRIGLHTEARTRFERGVDPEVAQAAVDRFVALLSSVPGGGSLRRGPTVDVADAQHLPGRRTVKVRTARVNGLLGTSLEESELAGLLGPIGFATEPAPDPEPEPDGSGSLEVTIPSWRLDSEREIDVVEEVARMYGYRRIDRTVPAGSSGRAGGLTAYQRLRRRARDILAGAGFDEAWTTTFLAPGDLERAGLDESAVEVENPLDRSESILRTSLLPGLLKAVRFNRDRQAGDVCLFEVGHVFAPPSPGSVTPEESEHLALVVAPQAGDPSPAIAATRAWRVLSDSLRFDGLTLLPAAAGGAVPGAHPSRVAVISGSRGRYLGWAGEVDPEVASAYGLSGRIGFLTVDFEALAEQPRLRDEAVPVSRYPASDVDLAFLLPEEVGAAQVRETLARAGGDLLESVWLFDVFRGDRIGADRKSLAFRLRFRAQDRTLDEGDVGRLRSEAIEAVTAAHGATLRG